MSAFLVRQGRNQNWHPDNLGRDVLRAWWSAADHGSTNMTDDGAGLISNWKDRIGGLALTAVTTARPTWTSNAINSAYPGVTFDGTANVMAAAATGNLPTAAVAGEIWALAFKGVGTGTRNLFSYGGTSVVTARRLLAILTSPTRFAVGDPSTFLTDTTINYISGLHITSGNWSGTTEGGRLDGAVTSPATATIGTLNTGTTKVRMGTDTSGTAFGDYVVSDILVTTTLTLAQQRQLEAWLAWRVGSQSLLPVSHPYAASRP